MNHLKSDSCPLLLFIFVSAYPGPPSKPQIVSAFKDCINLAWSAPSNTGGTNLLGYNVEKRKNGSNLWGLVNPPDEPIKGTGRPFYWLMLAIQQKKAKLKEMCYLTDVLSLLFVTLTEKKYAVKDVVEGIEYEFRVSAINISGAGEPSTPSEFVIARDPKSEWQAKLIYFTTASLLICRQLNVPTIFNLSEPPGKVIDLKVTDSTYTTLSLGWTKPIEEEGVQDEAKGYFVELRPAENPEWGRCNSSPIIMTSYTIMGLKSMAMYWVRVVATNEGGDGEYQELDNYIIAMPPPGE